MATEFAATHQSPSAAGGRRVVARTFVTLDGYIVGREEDMSWVIAGFHPEMQADIAEEMSRRADLFVFGRVTYEIFAAYWRAAVPYDEATSSTRQRGRIIRVLNESPKLATAAWPATATCPRPRPTSCSASAATRRRPTPTGRRWRSAARTWPSQEFLAARVRSTQATS